jgi:Holliday junction resolvase RusA-like endonuclease
MHWAKRHKHHSVWRDTVYVHALNNKIDCRNATGLVEVAVTFGTTQPNRRRDPHNYFLTVKAICDGLTLARAWADDDATHVTTLEPVFGGIEPNAVQIVLRWSE